MSFTFWRRRETLQTLLGLDDLRLKDLGLLRADVQAARRFPNGNAAVFLAGRRHTRTHG